MTKSKHASILAMLIVSLMLGNSFVVVAGVPAPPPVFPGTLTYVDGPWNVNTPVTYTNQVIVLTGNLTVSSTLTLVNSRLEMNCSRDGEYHVEVLNGGSLIFRDDNELFIEPEMRTSTLGTGNYYLWVRSGATFSCKNTTIGNVGHTGNGYLFGGTSPEMAWATWRTVTNGTFRLVVDGQVLNVWGCDFSAVNNNGNVATVIQTRIYDLGTGVFDGVLVQWTGSQFIFSSPTNADGLFVPLSSVNFLTAMATGGTDISGGDWLDCASTGNGWELIVDPSRSGPYFRTDSVNVVTSYIHDNDNLMYFDSCSPASLKGSVFENSQQFGIILANTSTPAWNYNGVLSDFNVSYANHNGVIIRAKQITVEAKNLNISDNGFGFTAMADTNLNANIHDNNIYYNNEDPNPDDGIGRGSAVYLLANGINSRTVATIQDNVLFENDCGGVWAGFGYADEADSIYKPSRCTETTVQFNRNTMIGNYMGSIFHAWDKIFVHAEDNFFGASDNTDYGDGMKIGTMKGDDMCTGNETFDSTHTANTTFEVLNNVFDYDWNIITLNNNREIGGVLRTGSVYNMDATVIGNKVKASGEMNIGGIFQIGSPHPQYTQWNHTRYLKALVEDNKVETLESGGEYPNIGGVFIFSAIEKADVTVLNNEYYMTAGGTGGIVEIHGGGENADTNIQLRNCTALIRGNLFYADPYSSGSGGIGGFIRLKAIGNVDIEIDNNEFIYKDSDGDANPGGIIRLERRHDITCDEYPFPAILKAKITNNYIETNFESTGYTIGGVVRIEPWNEMTVIILHNDIQLNLYSTDVGGIFRVGDTGYTPWNTTVEVEYNTVKIRDMYAGGTETEIGGFLWVNAMLNMNVKVNHNEFYLSMTGGSYSSGGHGEYNLAGWIRCGDKGGVDTPRNLNAEITDNIVDITIPDGGIGGFIRLYAIEKIVANIKDNDININYGGGTLGGFITVGDWGAADDCEYPTRDLETYLTMDNNNFQLFTEFDSGNTGGMMRVIGKERTDVTISNTVMQTSYLFEPMDQSDEDDMNDMGVRIGKHGFCPDEECMVSNNTVVSITDSFIGAGGKGAALMVAGSRVDFEMDGGSLYGAVYDDNWGFDHPRMYGNGLTLLSENRLTASISNVDIYDNRGAGIYAETLDPNGNVNIKDCTFTRNDFGGVYMNGVFGGRVSGTINGCEFDDNGIDEFDQYTEETAGLFFRHSTMIVQNCTINDPSTGKDFNATDNSHITSLNSQFNRDKVFVEANAAYLIGGPNYQTTAFLACEETAYWSCLSDGTFRITIDGHSEDIGPIDFGAWGTNDPYDVAAAVQYYIRDVTNASDGFLNATVEYVDYGNGNARFVITSGTKGVGSSIAKLLPHSDPTAGTDISGATVSTHARLEGGGAASAPCDDDWETLEDGTFQITVDGYTVDVGPLDFTTINYTGCPSDPKDVQQFIEDAINDALPASVPDVSVMWYSNGPQWTIFSGSDSLTASVLRLMPHSLGIGTDISGSTLYMETDDLGTKIWWLDMYYGTSIPAMRWLDCAASAAVTNSVQSDLLVQWFLNAKVVRKDTGQGIPESKVDVKGLDGTFTAQTDMVGMAYVRASEYFQTPTTKTVYTPHNVTATKSTFTNWANPLIYMNRTQSVTIELGYIPPAPVANAGTDARVLLGHNMQFGGSLSTGDWLSYSWAFKTSNANITLTGMYANLNCSEPMVPPDLYTVTLTVLDIWGASDTDTMQLAVIPVNPPIANAGPDRTVNEGAVVTFDGSASTGPTLNYTWTFTDGIAQTLYGMEPTHTFATPGTFTVTLKVTDFDGLTGTDTMVVTVNDITLPSVDAGENQTVPQGSIVEFDGTNCSDYVGIIEHIWTFNDGTNDVTLYGEQPSYTFENIGSYIVTLSCSDAAGNVGTDTMTVTVRDMTPPNVLVIAPGEGLTGVPINWKLVIVFSEPMDTDYVESSFSINGGATASTFEWDPTGRYVKVSFQGLQPDTTYTFTIGTGASDLNGNQLGSAVTGTFSTAAEPAEEPGFFNTNWWILVVIIVVLAVLLLVALLRGGKEPAPPAHQQEFTPMEPQPEFVEEPAPASAPPAEEEIQ